MSRWSQVIGVVSVNVYGRTQYEIEYVLQTVLSHLPVVSGSEDDMEVIPLKESSTMWNPHDEFGAETNNLENFWGQKSRERGGMLTQSCYTLLVRGSLRDMDFAETYKDFQKWLCRLAKRLFVDSIFVKVEDFYKSCVIDESNAYSKMYENFSWNSKFDGEYNWCEYLYWDKAKDSSYPDKLIRKYQNGANKDVQKYRYGANNKEGSTKV